MVTIRDIKSDRDFYEFLKRFGLDDNQLDGIDVKMPNGQDLTTFLQDANNLGFDGTQSGLVATSVQAAIDEVAVMIVPFTFNTVSPFTLKGLVAGHVIRAVMVKVDTIFDGAFAMTLGFPADPDEIIEAGQVDLTQQNVYMFDVYRVSAVVETLQAYFTGTPTVGSGNIFVW